MPRKSRKNVGLIGLGIIGSRVAAGLRASGYHVFVWNRNPRPVPNFLGSPLEVAEMCEVIQLFVADGQAVFQTIEAFGDALTDKHVVVNCATIGPEGTLEAARMVQARGAAFLDCPFTGSKGAAEKAQLVYYVGGDSAVFERVKPVLEATSRAIVHCGKIGDAAVLKVATNMITAVTTQTLAEALAIVRKCGIAPEAFGAAIQQNACKSGVVDLKLPKMLTGDYSPHFSLKHMFKDVQLGIQLANSMQLEIPATAATAGVLFGGMNKGWADMDFASVFKQFSDNEPPEPVKSISAISEAKAAETAALIEEMERAEFIEAQIIPDAKKAEEPVQQATPPKPEPAPEPIWKKEGTVVPEPKAEAPAPAPPPAKPAASPAPARDVEELARAIAGIGKSPSGAGGESAKISATIQGAKVIEAEVVEAEAKPGDGTDVKSERSAQSDSNAESKPDEKDQGFRPFQRLRRFFSPAGK
jgi:3-hydroxyisobutyrate dehydrogenase-like beta-hydroxyacid dehydrogenase